MNAVEYNADEYHTFHLTWAHITEMVRAYQAAHGLPADGKAGPKTRAVLDAVLSFPTTPETGLPAEVEAWRPDIERDLRAENMEVDKWMDFLLHWVEVESRGNPCAEGIIAHDGFHVEAGIGQVYFDRDRGANPVVHGVTSAQLRLGCTGPHCDSIRVDRGAQVRSLVRMAGEAYLTATRHLAAQGLTWSDRDVLRLTKLVHALPAVLKMLTASTATFADLRANTVDRAAGYFLFWIPALAPFAGEPMRRVFANCTKTVP